ncbi:hypothetical protein JVT61DRAFT_6097 [Boletus reticuloceps]|uniref:Uncharacterized protein n=1 Tax=Boletus reticuloceps TaxID=495285 RepID=A0A8I2YLE1_9AGAM|nr:hypothetical protein JVT61DRAFT_6097 [Boletus reticuloceps]
MTASKSHQVSAFYDVSDNPPPMPLLSYQTEIVYQTTTPVIISAGEEMLTGAYHAPTRVSLQIINKRSNTPIPPAHQFKVVRVITPSPEGSEESASYQRSEHSPTPTESSLSSLESKDDTQIGRIPKPNGEAGRPGRGGYNLEEKLGWGEDGFKELKNLHNEQKFVNKAIRCHLDVTKCRSLQDRQALDSVKYKVSQTTYCQWRNHTYWSLQALERFPDLIDFENCWPVFDLIQLRLKYTSSQCRQRKSPAVGKASGKEKA